MVVKNTLRIRKTPSELSAVRRAAGRQGGYKKHGKRSLKNLEKDLIREHIDQRLMRATDVYINGQMSLAKGLQFLYRIDKTFIRTGKDKNTGEQQGYYRNEKPVLVESQWEIETYLETLAENNGDISDNDDESAAYYFITAKAPDGQAIEQGLARVHGRAPESIKIETHHTFSLAELATSRNAFPALNGNSDVTILPTNEEEQPDAHQLDVPDIEVQE